MQDGRRETHLILAWWLKSLVFQNPPDFFPHKAGFNNPGGDLLVYTLGVLERDWNEHLTDCPISCPAPSPWWPMCHQTSSRECPPRNSLCPSCFPLESLTTQMSREQATPPLLSFWRRLREQLPKLVLNLHGIPSTAKRSDQSREAGWFGKGRPQPSLFLKRSPGR